jgi:sugar (pentulose or hexulose) kinase
VSISVYLGIDVGTSGIRGCIIDDDCIKLVSHQIAFDTPPIHRDGCSEQDPNIWLEKLDHLITKVSRALQDLNNAYQIKSIAIDGTSGTLIACKKDGSPLSPALMYNDQQSWQQAEMISRFAPTQSAVHGASSSLAKALLLLERYPATEIFCHQADWLTASLTGQYNISDENNCLKLGYDSITQSWPGWLQNNDENTTIPVELLPQVVAPGTRIGKVKSSFIKKYQLDEDCHMVAGTTDSNAAVLATGAGKIGDAVTSLGSTLVLKLFSDKPIFNPEYGIYSHRLNGHWLVGGASNSGGKVLLQQFTQKQLEKMTPLLKPEQPTGLSYYPLPDIGERFPVNDSNKTSNIDPRPESDLTYFQGLLEGIASIEADGYKKLHALGTPAAQRIFTTGGGNKNSAWKIIRERMTGIKVIDAIHHEASYGSALLAKKGFKSSE